jgi:hypothetical protein
VLHDVAIAATVVVTTVTLVWMTSTARCRLLPHRVQPLLAGTGSRGGPRRGPRAEELAAEEGGDELAATGGGDRGEGWRRRKEARTPTSRPPSSRPPPFGSEGGRRGKGWGIVGVGVRRTQADSWRRRCGLVEAGGEDGCSDEGRKEMHHAGSV